MKYGRRLLCVAAALLLSLFCVPTAYAADTYTVYIGGAALTASSDGTASYYVNGASGTVGTVSQTESAQYHAKFYFDTATQQPTLALNGMQLTAASSADLPTRTGIYTDGALTIQLSGTNSVTSASYNQANFNYADTYGIYAGGNLAILGDGSLSVTAADQKGSSYAVYTGGSAAIACSNLTLNAGETTGIGSGWKFYSCGIFAEENIGITGGKVTATAKHATRQSSGLYALGKITIDSANVTATAGIGYASGMINAYSYAINGEADIEILNSTVIATADDGTTSSAGIYAGELNYNVHTSSLTIDKSTVSARGGDTNADQARGIFAMDELTMTDSTVSGISGNAPDYSQGIGSYNAMVINGGRITAISESTEASRSFGLFSDWDLTIGGNAVVNATAGDGCYRSIGICVYQHLHISGSPIVTATAADTLYDDENTVSCGIYLGTGHYDASNPTIDDRFTMTGGTLTARASADAKRTAALSMLDAALYFSDAAQTNDQWYQWKIVESAAMTPSPTLAYDHNLSENNSSLYLHIEPYAPYPVDPDPDDPIVPPATDIPATGDGMELFLFAGLLLLSVVGIAATRRRTQA